MTSKPAIPRSFQFALFLTGCFWLLAADNAAARISQAVANRLDLALIEAPLQQALLVVALLLGFTLLNWIATRSGSVRETTALPKRATSKQEFARGAALGWAMLLAVALPLMLLGNLHPQVWLMGQAWMRLLVSIVTLLLTTLTLEIAFRGYLFARLTAAAGPVLATMVMSFAYAMFLTYRPTF